MSHKPLSIIVANAGELTFENCLEVVQRGETVAMLSVSVRSNGRSADIYAYDFQGGHADEKVFTGVKEGEDWNLLFGEYQVDILAREARTYGGRFSTLILQATASTIKGDPLKLKVSE